MFTELIASFIPALIAAVILIPVAAFLLAMLFEGVRGERWGTIRRATRCAIDSTPLRLPVQRQTTSGGGGLGFRRVSAAPHEHE